MFVSVNILEYLKCLDSVGGVSVVFGFIGRSEMTRKKNTKYIKLKDFFI